MKSTKTVLAVAIVIAGFASFGCGSDVAGGVSLTDARAECDLFQTLADGEPLSDGEFNTWIIEAEAQRDSGISELTFLQSTQASCTVAPTTAVRSQCLVCAAAITAAVYP